MSNTWAHPGLATYAAEALAIGWARIMYRSEPRKVLIMVTDGQVAQNTTHLVRAIEKQGTLVIGVGIGVDVRKTFPHAVQIDNAADLPNRFARLMKQFLPADGKWRAAA
ncbi:MAG: VWA domain-containing protein [Actinobacteria bacterium]|nr:VWA domain-containing protein [Actinomycetota bacterium]